jgi:excisionase family DNA binding protein
MLENYGDIMNINELCKSLRIGKSKAYSLLLTKQLAAYKEGKDWKIQKQSVVEYIKGKCKQR